MKRARIIRELTTIAIFCAAGVVVLAFGPQRPYLWPVGSILGLSGYLVIILSKALADQLNPRRLVRRIPTRSDERLVPIQTEIASRPAEQPGLVSLPAMEPQEREPGGCNLQDAGLSV